MKSKLFKVYRTYENKTELVTTTDSEPVNFVKSLYKADKKYNVISSNDVRYSVTEPSDFSLCDEEMTVYECTGEMLGVDTSNARTTFRWLV